MTGGVSNAHLVERFGQTGTIADLYQLNGIDAQGIMRTAQPMTAGRTAGRPIRYLRPAVAVA